MEIDYELRYLQLQEKTWRLWLEHLRYYQLFELPTIIKQIEVSLEKRTVSDLRTSSGTNKSPHSPP